MKNIFRVLLDRVKTIVIANQWSINSQVYVLLLKNGTFEVTIFYLFYFKTIARF